MLSFQEQTDIINHIYGNDLNIDYFNEFINRGNDEEALFNYVFIHKVFKQRLNNMNLKNEFTEFVKFYINFFIIHNKVYFKSFKDINFNEQPHELQIHKEIPLYDSRTNEIIVNLKWVDYRKNEIVFYPTWADTQTKIPIIEFDDYEHLKELKNVLVYGGRLYNHVHELAHYNKILYEAVKNDDVDTFINLCVHEPKLLTCQYNFANIWFIGLFEILILCDAIKCFKYVLTCPEKSKIIYHKYISQTLAISNNAECFRLLNQEPNKLYTRCKLIQFCLQYHSNELAKHLLYTHGGSQNLKLYIKGCLEWYNYDMLTFCVENFETDALLKGNKSNAEICKDHMIALLGLYDECDTSLLESWHNAIIHLISYPISADYFVKVVNRVPISCETMKNSIYEDYLYECFSHQKPITFINTISCFLCGSKVWNYNHENEKIRNINPTELLIKLYNNGMDVDIVDYILIMFNTTYKNYEDSDLTKFSLNCRLSNKYKNLQTLRKIFIKFYNKMLAKMK